MAISKPRLQFVASLIKHHELLWRLSEREIAGRYRGSLLGLGWTLLNPLMMLAVYTFVFSTVFKSRWPDLQQAGALGFAINLFTGLIVFNLISECIGKAPALILGQPNYVTKIVFPLELLGATAVAASCFHAIASLVVLAGFELIATGTIPITAVLLPLVWLPLILGCLGGCWLLSALGVYLRDLPQFVNVSLSILMFLSAVFYPVSALPDAWQPIMHLNPIAGAIEQTRRVLVSGHPPSFTYAALGIPLGIAWCEASFMLFQRARRGFADVI